MTVILPHRTHGGGGGENGSGWLWVADTEHWEVCDCGGRPDKGAHYRIKSPPPVVPKNPIRTDWRNE